MSFEDSNVNSDLAQGGSLLGCLDYQQIIDTDSTRVLVKLRTSIWY